MDKEIKIEYQPNIDNLMKVSKYLLLNIRFVKYFPIAFIVLFLISKLPLLINSNEIVEEKSYLNDLLTYCFIIILWVFIYFRTLSSMKKNILSNKKNNEFQIITLNEKSYLQEGETFKIENFWNETYQIKENKNWFLIYPKKNTAFPILKADLKDNQYNELKELFNSLNIKKSLM